MPNTLVWVMLVIGLPSPIHALSASDKLPTISNAPLYVARPPALINNPSTDQLFSTQVECNKAAKSYTKPSWATTTPQDLVVACIEAYKIQ